MPQILESVAINNEVMVALSNQNLVYEGMVKTYTDMLKRAKVTNFVLVALDDETERWCKDNDVFPESFIDLYLPFLNANPLFR